MGPQRLEAGMSGPLQHSAGGKLASRGRLRETPWWRSLPLEKNEDPSVATGTQTLRRVTAGRSALKADKQIGATNRMIRPFSGKTAN